MRIVQVSGSTGPGFVVEVHSVDSVEALEEFLEARGIQDRAIAAPDWVLPGITYDGADFVQPQVDPPTEPTPMPRTVEQVKAELDGIRERKMSEYVAQWGDLSKRELWPRLSPEIIDLAGKAPADVNPEAYPMLCGFVEESGFPVDPPEGETSADKETREGQLKAIVVGYGAKLRGHMRKHSFHLRRGEEKRNQLLSEYEALSDEEKLAWDAETAWAAEETS